MSTDDDDDDDDDDDCAITLYDPQKILRSYKNNITRVDTVNVSPCCMGHCQSK